MGLNLKKTHGEIQAHYTTSSSSQYRNNSPW